jgi:hypothetical protein
LGQDRRLLLLLLLLRRRRRRTSMLSRSAKTAARMRMSTVSSNEHWARGPASL